jgi:nitrogenase-associated protein
MARVVFWEKPGCAGNARQKALLFASGHKLDVRNLLTEPWDAARLRSFFGARPVANWFKWIKN